MKSTKADISDETLMRNFIVAKDDAAYAELYKRYFDAISNYLGWLSNNQEQGKDIAQNTFYNIYRNPQVFDTSKKFKLWLYAVAKNMWKNDLRQSKTRAKHHTALTEHRPAEDNESTQHPVPEKEKLENIQQAVDELSPVHKEVFVLKYKNNLTINEISEICACSAGTIKSRLFYALKEIRSRVK